MIPQQVNVHQYEGGPVNLYVNKRDRDLAIAQAERVPCPGCSGEAWAEASPVTVWRDGQSRTVRVVTCHAGCVTEIKSRRRSMSAANEAGFARTRPSRFEIMIAEEEPADMPKVADISPPEKRDMVAQAIEAYGRGAKSIILREFKILANDLDRWLRTGAGLGPTRLPRLLAWAEEVLARQTAPETTPGPSNEGADPIFEPEDEERTFDQDPCPEASLPKGQECCACRRDCFSPEPAEWSRPPDPAAEVLEHIAVTQLVYALETRGIKLPEGYRFRVTVERCEG